MGKQIFFILSAITMIDNKSLLVYKSPKALGLQYYRVGDKSLFFLTFILFY